MMRRWKASTCPVAAAILACSLLSGCASMSAVPGGDGMEESDDTVIVELVDGQSPSDIISEMDEYGYTVEVTDIGDGRHEVRFTDLGDELDIDAAVDFLQNSSSVEDESVEPKMVPEGSQG